MVFRRGGRAPSSRNVKPWLCVTARRGLPNPRHKTLVVCHYHGSASTPMPTTQAPSTAYTRLHCANLWICVTAGRGHAPLTRNTNPQFCVGGQDLHRQLVDGFGHLLDSTWTCVERKNMFRHQRNIKSYRLMIFPFFEEIKRLRWVWTQKGQRWTQQLIHGHSWKPTLP